MRMISIIMTDLATDKLKAEEKLQRLINDNGDIDTNVTLIKEQLKEIVLVDRMIVKWKNYTTTNDDDNKEDNND